MIKVAVLAGGRSAEHDISLLSAQQVLAGLDRSRWRPWPVFLDRRGAWWPAAGPLDGAMPPDFRLPGMRPLRPGAALEALVAGGVEVVFPVLHGPFGEDGRVQGMLELYDLPCVGPGSAASAVAMDKIRTRECLAAHGLPMPRAYLPEASIRRADAALEAARIGEAVGYPCFLKVDLSGSTSGVRRAEGPEDVAPFLEEARGLGERFLAEEWARGEEVSVPVLGNCDHELVPLPPVGIYPRSDPYFTRRAKYEEGQCVETVPPRGLDSEGIARVQELGLRCHRALRCDGMSRTDVIVGAGGPVVLEVNTIPGLTRTSLLPKAALAHGLPFPALLTELLELALARRSVAI